MKAGTSPPPPPQQLSHPLHLLHNQIVPRPCPTPPHALALVTRISSSTTAAPPLCLRPQRRTLYTPARRNARRTRAHHARGPARPSPRATAAGRPRQRVPRRPNGSAVPPLVLNTRMSPRRLAPEPVRGCRHARSVGWHQRTSARIVPAINRRAHAHVSARVERADKGGRVLALYPLRGRLSKDGWCTARPPRQQRTRCASLCAARPARAPEARAESAGTRAQPVGVGSSRTGSAGAIAHGQGGRAPHGRAPERTLGSIKSSAAPGTVGEPPAGDAHAGGSARGRNEVLGSTDQKTQRGAGGAPRTATSGPGVHRGTHRSAARRSARAPPPA